MKFLIYGLRDPVTREVRYVGKSTCGMRRPRQHLQPAALAKAQGHKANWIRERWTAGLLPEIVVLQILSTSTGLPEAERFWVAVGRSALGNRLTNLTAGGDGTSGYSHSEKTREKISKAATGRPKTAETRAKHAAHGKARAATPEWRSRFDHSGRKRTAAHRAKIGEANTKRRITPETRSKMSESAKRRTASPEARARMGALPNGKRTGKRREAAA